MAIMKSTLQKLSIAALLCSIVGAQSSAPSSTSTYVGYNVTYEGDPDSVVFSTDDTNPNATFLEPNPDVFLNASVSVGEISLEVDDLTAKINLDLEILQLLSFNAGVNVAISEVRLLIQNVQARVLLEARLQNLVKMVDDTLSSIDLNPVIATLGEDVDSIVNNTVSGVTGSSSSGTATASGTTSSTASPTTSVDKRSYDITHNILYAVNDYSGNTHTNRILAQNGDIVDKFLDNTGQPHGQKLVGTYAKDMSPIGKSQVVEWKGSIVSEQEYKYVPHHGIAIVSLVFTDDSGNVVGTQVLLESGGGGRSTISDDL